MKKKAFLVSIISLFSVSLLISSAYAQTATVTPYGPTIRALNTTGSLQGPANQNRITNLKARADQEIDRRVTSLNKLITRISRMKRLTAAQITTFTTSIQTEITNLTNLKTKIDADTDLPTLQTDVKSIVFSYRVYALYMPQLNILASADRILEITAKLNLIVAKLQTRISQAQGKGQNVAGLQTTLTDMQGKISDAVTQANNAISEVTPLTPDGYPGNKSTLMDARSKIKTAVLDIQAAGQDAKTIISSLKSLAGSTGVVNALTPTVAPPKTTPSATITTQP